MTKFARLFDLENDEQVLAYVEYHDEDEQYQLHIKMSVNDSTAKMVLGYTEMKIARETLSNYTITDAQNFRNTMAEMFIMNEKT